LGRETRGGGGEKKKIKVFSAYVRAVRGSTDWGKKGWIDSDEGIIIPLKNKRRGEKA